MRRALVLLFSLLLFAAVGAAAFAQNLATTTNTTVVDGVVNPGEYSFSKAFEGLTLYANRTASSLYLAGLLEGEIKTQKEIAQAASVTEVTVRNRYKGLRADLGKELGLDEMAPEIAAG